MLLLLFLPLLARVSFGCSTWKKGPCVIPYRVDGTIHTECLNREGFLSLLFVIIMSFSASTGRCLMRSLARPRWDFEVISPMLVMSVKSLFLNKSMFSQNTLVGSDNISSPFPFTSITTACIVKIGSLHHYDCDCLYHWWQVIPMCPTSLGRNGEAEEWGRCPFTDSYITRHQTSNNRHQT